MRRVAVAVLLVLAATAATIAVAVALPGQRTRAVAAYLLLLGALGTGAALARVLRTRRPRSAFEAALASPKARPGRLRALERIENDCIQGLANPVDLELRLGPRLREIAAQRLAVRHGIDLDGRPEAARTVLGEELWELVQSDLARPGERGGLRIDSAALGRALDTLEAV